MDTTYEVIFGRLGRDPELKYTKSGTPICSLSMATQLNKSQDPLWRKVTVWGEQAKKCDQLLRKGSQLFIRGRPLLRNFTYQNGRAVPVEEFNAHLVGFSII